MLYFLCGEIVKIGLAHPEKTTIAAHPEVSSAVFQKAPHGVVEQAIFDPITCELAVFITHQARAISPKQQYMVGIFMDRSHTSSQEAWVLIALELPIFEERQAFFPSEPKAAFMVLKDHPHTVGPSVVLGKDGELSILVAGKTSVTVADPPGALAVSIQRVDRIAGQSIFDGITPN